MRKTAAGLSFWPLIRFVIAFRVFGDHSGERRSELMDRRKDVTDRCRIVITGFT